jgi:hypothetical protein
MGNEGEKTMDFVEFLQGLAPKGETLLVVRQKPVLRDGQQALHADGTPKYTWPAFLPSKKRADGAWYANTGSFILDRFKDGQPSASAANCEYVLVMMLDDVGTKAKEPPLAPTWIMETSEGSFQWGYAFADQPSKGEFTAAMTAIAEAGYTDPGATNAVRNFRLPGSTNLKPGRDGFRARLVDFHPTREYTLEEICVALGVTPAAADTATTRAFRLRDTGKDVVLEWLNEQGLVLSGVNQEGWLGVVCPNAAEHTTGQNEARYNPINRAFCCYHGHCEGLDSAAFLKWVCDQGGPRATPGLRDELLAEQMSRTLDKLAPTPDYPDRAAEIIAEVERKELGRIEKSAWYERFAYVLSDDSYFDLVDRREISRYSFNALFRHIPCKSIHSGKKIEAATCFDENRQAMGARVLVGVTYAAGESVLVSRSGDVYGNRWVNARPDVSAAPRGDVSRWIDHCRRLVPDPADLDHIWDVMAFKLQNPSVKINHAILHGGHGGSGKDTMWAPFMWAVCGPQLINRGLMDGDTINGQWGYALESEVILLNELKEPEARERRALANRLKPIIAAPPEYLVVNRKGLHPYDTLNRAFVLAFSNDMIPLTLSSDDRRWFVVWSTAGQMDPVAAQEMWRWYKEEGGFAQIAQWLYARDVSAFAPGATPPMTDVKASLVEHSMSSAESGIVDMIRNRQGEFSRGVIAGPFHALCDRLQAQMPPGVKVPQAALLHAVQEARWVDVGRVHTAEHATKKHIFAAPEMAKRHSKSDLRRMVEHAAAPKVVDLKVVG